MPVIPIPLDIRTAIFYIVHNQGDRKTSAALLRLNRETYLHLRGRFYHTPVPTHTNAEAFVDYFFERTPPDHIATAVKRIFLAELPDFDTNFTAMRNRLDLMNLYFNEEEELHSAPLIRQTSHPFPNLRQVVLGRGLIVDAALAAHLYPEDARPDFPDFPLSSWIVWLCGRSVDVDITAPARPNITLCFDYRSLPSSTEFDLAFRKSTVVANSSLNPGGDKDAAYYTRMAQKVLMSAFDNHILDQMGNEIQAVHHDAYRFLDCEETVRGTLRLDFADGVRSYVNPPPIPDADKGQHHRAPMSGEKPEDYTVRIDIESAEGKAQIGKLYHRLILGNYFRDAPAGWLEGRLRAAGWPVSGEVMVGEEVWLLLDGALTMVFRRRELVTADCGCVESRVGGALPDLKGRAGM